MKNTNTNTKMTMTKPQSIPPSGIPSHGRPQRTPQAQNRNPSQKPHSRTNHSTFLLKSSLVVGTVAATLWGTKLLATIDAAQTMAETSVEPIVLSASITTNSESSSMTLSTTGVTLSPNTVAPIPTVRAILQPTPVAGGISGANALTVTATPVAPLTLEPIPEAIVPDLPSESVSLANEQLTVELPMVELPSIPSVQIPAPVTRSRSSR